ncbi:mannitol dehydrogenase family protein, partial [Novosphingobium sp. 1Y9A]
LVEWFAANCTCPSTMIDRIVPATTDEDRASVAEALGGLTDEACVVTEPFSQWVIEDRFAGPRPRWEAVGAQLVSEVAPYEAAKLRMLNGAHSLLAYCGLKAGYEFVHEAIADPQLRHLAEQLMRREAAPTITPAPGQDLAAYADALIARFANPSLNHRLIQIAMDGSQKIPQRWLETLAANATQGHDCPAIRQALAAWIHHLQGHNGPVDDPRSADLTRAANSPEPMVALFGDGGPMAQAWGATIWHCFGR